MQPGEQRLDPRVGDVPAGQEVVQQLARRPVGPGPVGRPALFRRGPDLFSVLTNTSAAERETTLELDVAEYERREARVLVPARGGTFVKLDAAEKR